MAVGSKLCVVVVGLDGKRSVQRLSDIYLIKNHNVEVPFTSAKEAQHGCVDAYASLDQRDSGKFLGDSWAEWALMHRGAGWEHGFEQVPVTLLLRSC